MTGFAPKEGSFVHSPGDVDLGDEHLSEPTDFGRGIGVEAGADGRHDLGASSNPHLEAILGKINAVMAGQSDDPRSDHLAPETDESLARLKEALPMGETGVAIAPSFDTEQNLEDPVDLLAPYNDVLKEVSGFFNERETRQRAAQRFAAPEQNHFQQVVGGDPHFQMAQSVPQGEPERFDAEARAGAGEASFKREVPSYSSILEEPDLYKPVEFEQPLATSIAPPGAMLAEQPDVQGLQRELMSRIGQLEQVIGHHFGQQQDVVRDVAKAAVEMTLNDIDKTSIGQRLSALEQAIESLKNTPPMAQTLPPAEAEKTLNSGDGGAPAADDLQGEALPEALGAARALRDGKVHEGGLEDGVENRGVQDVKSKDSGADNIRAKNIRPQDMVPQGRGLDETGLNDGGGDRSAVSAVKAALAEEYGDICVPVRDKKMSPASQTEGPAVVDATDGKGPEPDGPQGGPEKDVDTSSLKDFQNLFKGEGSGVFGRKDKTSIDPSIDSAEAPLSATEQMTAKEALGPGAPMSARDMTPPQAATDVEGDAFLAKTVSLREQFNQSNIVSNDDDLRTVQPKGARPMILFVALALILAAVGIGLGSKSFGDVELFKQIFQRFSDEGQTEGRSKRAVELDQNTPAALNDASLRGDADLSVTGAIVTRRGGDGKAMQRLSDGDASDLFEGHKTPETLLPMAAGRLTLPPVGIGPYSLRHAAANGDANAQFEVARRFGMGQGVERDFDEALRWYVQAAAQGFAPAQYRLGTFYERGRSVERSLPQAKVWYKRAAELGNVKAMHNLAVINTAINRDKPDYQFSIYWFKQAAVRNLADSQFNLAILYQNGVGVPKNLVESYRWFSLAARQGDLDAARRRDLLEKKMKKSDLLLAANMLQAWKATPIDVKANEVGLKGVHVTSTLSHAHETVQRSRVLTTQILLRKLGYRLQDADGVLNEVTVKAIKKFEKDKGLPITGKVTPDLLKMLNKAAL